MNKKCNTCGKMGHTSSTCTRGNTSNNKSSHYKPPQNFQPHQNFQSHNVNTSNQPVYYTMEPVITPPQQYANVTNALPKSGMRTVTFNQFSGPGVSGSNGQG